MVYTAFHVRQGQVGKAVESVRVLGIRGLSVTIPHKVDIIPYLDEVEEISRKVGSVNTVLNENGLLKGVSTDGQGALRALGEYDVDPGGKKILVLGTGGAARAIAFSLASLKKKPSLCLLGVEGEEMRRLVSDLEMGTGVEVNGDFLDATSLKAQVQGAEIVINATPIGMSPNSDQTLIPAKLLRKDMVVFDAVYTPRETRLLREAKKAGAKSVPGLGMFVHQAAVQFELWTRMNAPVKLMTETVLEALGELQQ
jgi:shikimate dehydrogenase